MKNRDGTAKIGCALNERFAQFLFAVVATVPAWGQASGQTRAPQNFSPDVFLIAGPFVEIRASAHHSTAQLATRGTY